MTGAGRWRAFFSQTPGQRGLCCAHLSPSPPCLGPYHPLIINILWPRVDYKKGTGFLSRLLGCHLSTSPPTTGPPGLSLEPRWIPPGSPTIPEHSHHRACFPLRLECCLVWQTSRFSSNALKAVTLNSTDRMRGWSSHPLGTLLTPVMTHWIPYLFLRNLRTALWSICLRITNTWHSAYSTWV